MKLQILNIILLLLPLSGYAQTDTTNILIFHEVVSERSRWSLNMDGGLTSLVTSEGDTVTAWIEHHVPGDNLRLERYHIYGIDMIITCYPSSLRPHNKKLAVFPNWDETVWIGWPAPHVLLVTKTEAQMKWAFKMVRSSHTSDSSNLGKRSRHDRLHPPTRGYISRIGDEVLLLEPFPVQREQVVLSP